jgi:hypothetical protein
MSSLREIELRPGEEAAFAISSRMSFRKLHESAENSRDLALGGELIVDC